MDQEQMVSAVLQAVQALPQSRQPLIVALDGRCASGKTTLAALLQQRTGCSVVHMDHFFLRPEQRTRERLEQPGGNVDYERFLAEVLEPLRAGKDCSYRPYDCKQQKLAEPVAVRQDRLIVVEGSYSCHPTLWERYDLHVFLTVNPQEQLRRIERRNGPQGLEMFRQRWIPLEERYFSACRVEERCELRLSSGEYKIIQNKKTGLELL